jgi:hypothetical protein
MRPSPFIPTHCIVVFFSLVKYMLTFAQKKYASRLYQAYNNNIKIILIILMTLQAFNIRRCQYCCKSALRVASLAGGQSKRLLPYSHLTYIRAYWSRARGRDVSWRFNSSMSTYISPQGINTVQWFL